MGIDIYIELLANEDKNLDKILGRKVMPLKFYIDKLILDYIKMGIK